MASIVGAIECFDDFAEDALHGREPWQRSLDPYARLDVTYWPDRVKIGLREPDQRTGKLDVVGRASRRVAHGLRLKDQGAQQCLRRADATALTLSSYWSAGVAMRPFACAHDSRGDFRCQYSRSTSSVPRH